MASGSYLLLAVGSVSQTDALAEAFSDAAGGAVKEPIIFYSGETGGGGADIGPELETEPTEHVG